MTISRLLRRMRWRLRRWTSDTDRAYHDQAFATGPADPFSFAYPGYITIRRFADLAAERVAGASRVLDVGCGPGEITCELASRFPACRFEGFDHSAVAIERARARRAPRAGQRGLHDRRRDDGRRTGTRRPRADVRLVHHEVERDGLRSPLPRAVGPDGTATIAFRVSAPRAPGRYLLAVDLVEEGIAWFSEAGVPCLTIGVTVTAHGPAGKRGQ